MNILDNIEKAKGGEYFTPSQIEEYLNRIGEYTVSRKFKGRRYLNLVSAFDTETTSYRDENENEYGWMYVWMFAIDGIIMVGRTWTEFNEFILKLKAHLKLSDERRLITYVHNNSFDFAFYNTQMNFTDVFAKERRVPLYAVADSGIEFRCSYLLTNSSLEQVGKNLNRIKANKQIGDLDYNKIRHSKTPLTKAEMNYCLYDVIVLSALIYDKLMDENGAINKIPYTQTGYVRRHCRNNCLQYGDTKEYFKYQKLMQRLTLTPEEYIIARSAFAGGFTHANALWVGDTVTDVYSMDFTSSYPAVMISEYYPMSSGTKIDPRTIKTREEFFKFLHTKCCLFRIIVKGVKAKITQDYYLSVSKCFPVDCVESNGRIVEAKEITFTGTEKDFFIFERCYDYDTFYVQALFTYRRGYLPKSYIETAIELYKKKTEYKDVEDKKTEYSRAKEHVNSLYGMMVTDVLNDEVIYNKGAWETHSVSTDDGIDEYNNNKRRFLSYLWGVWVTAHARFNLWTGILALGNDYIYADTDSVKFINYEKHKDYFEYYNTLVDEKMLEASKEVGFNVEDVRPRTVKGIEKPLGHWDFDGHYKRFKTLGAKRYMVEYDNDEMSLTVSGVNKKTAMPWFKHTFKTNTNIFKAFDEDLLIPGEYNDNGVMKPASGKMIVKYYDTPFSIEVKDYLGNKANVSENSYIFMERTSYAVGISAAFKKFLESIGNYKVGGNI